MIEEDKRLKPLIGITGSIDVSVKTNAVLLQPQQMHQLSDNYVRAIEQAGGIPVFLPACSDLSLVKEMVDSVDAVLLSGGSDIDPALFHERATARLRPVSPRRDAFDVAVAEYVLKETDKPLLGICRGIQVMNAVMGGSLYIDLEEGGKMAHNLVMYPRTAPSHFVTVEGGSRLSSILGEGTFAVNSLHHQAVKTVADAFVAAAYSVPDGVVEAIEKPGDRFVMGIQWHPEALDDPEHKKIFRGLVEAARENAGK